MAFPITFLILSLLALLITPSISIRTSVIHLPSSIESHSATATYCESWRLAAETNNAGTWNVVPGECVDSVAGYVNGNQYGSDYNVLADYAIAFAETIQIAGDGKDAWIFDVDDALLSNLDYYKTHGYGSVPYDDNAFSNWVLAGSAPAFDASLKLYSAVKKLGFTIILLTGRDEYQRGITESNLKKVGYSGWERHILRGSEDQGKAATKYKSEQRAKLVEEGFRIRGNVGDQWSDLLGSYEADRSFKVPNPMYYIP